MMTFKVCGARQNFYVFSLYRNPDLNDQICDCLLTSMPAVQAKNVRASFMSVGDLNGNHQSSGVVGFYDHTSWCGSL